MNVSFSGLYVKANTINKELNLNSARLTKPIVVRLIKNTTKFSKIQRWKGVEKTDLHPQMMKWHCTLPEGLKNWARIVMIFIGNGAAYHSANNWILTKNHCHLPSTVAQPMRIIFLKSLEKSQMLGC